MYKLNYQILKAAEARDVCGMIESNSNGFVFDFARSDVSKINDFFSLIEDLKGRFLISTKYRGSVKTPRSNTVVVFANQLPNLELLSMDRWSFFHPKLGHVGVKCSGQSNKGSLYNCEISQINSCDDLETGLKIPLKKTDKEAYEEYINNFFVRSNMQMIASNALAFPNARIQASMIMTLVRQKKFMELESFLKEQDCLANSITTLDNLFGVTSSSVVSDSSSDE
ncbi:uncharacterized protein LOC124327718 [Daphnia pulicaria]|uniref:uncharacterized protein LOC124327718 n=1 Tax=Daphnia pulicaria TaxID=35523 RepID=UPI001EEB636B|nr:uncharacterized protein LOC124327718 [Daphnia pulicaria]